jgi:hypothetical protein
MSEKHFYDSRQPKEASAFVLNAAVWYAAIAGCA